MEWNGMEWNGMEWNHTRHLMSSKCFGDYETRTTTTTTSSIDLSLDERRLVLIVCVVLRIRHAEGQTDSISKEYGLRTRE